MLKSDGEKPLTSWYDLIVLDPIIQLVINDALETIVLGVACV